MWENHQPILRRTRINSGAFDPIHRLLPLPVIETLLNAHRRIWRGSDLLGVQDEVKAVVELKGGGDGSVILLASNEEVTKRLGQ